MIFSGETGNKEWAKITNTVFVCNDNTAVCNDIILHIYGKSTTFVDIANDNGIFAIVYFLTDSRLEKDITATINMADIASFSPTVNVQTLHILDLSE